MKCLYCDKEIDRFTIYGLVFDQDQLCVDCRKKMKYNHQRFKVEGINVETFYEYNSLYKDLLLQYKECYDEALKDVFLYRIGNYIKLKYIGYKVVYIPSSISKIKERGFNHLEEMFKILGFEEIKGLKLINETSQQGKNYEERQKMLNNYECLGKYVKKLLIVDDVYTSGSSLRGVIKIMSKYAGIIKVVILAKT